MTLPSEVSPLPRKIVHSLTVGQVTTLSGKSYYIYGGVSYHILCWFLLHLWLFLHLELIFITFSAGWYFI